MRQLLGPTTKGNVVGEILNNFHDEGPTAAQYVPGIQISVFSGATALVEMNIDYSKHF